MRNGGAIESGAAVAIVIGGAVCWRDDLDAALALIGDVSPEYYAVNDQIAVFPSDVTACTLHPEN